MGRSSPPPVRRDDVPKVRPPSKQRLWVAEAPKFLHSLPRNAPCHRVGRPAVRPKGWREGASRRPLEGQRRFDPCP